MLYREIAAVGCEIPKEQTNAFCGRKFQPFNAKLRGT